MVATGDFQFSLERLALALFLLESFDEQSDHVTVGYREMTLFINRNHLGQDFLNLLGHDSCMTLVRVAVTSRESVAVYGCDLV